MSVPYTLDWPYYFLNSEEFARFYNFLKLCCRGYFRKTATTNVLKYVDRIPYYNAVKFSCLQFSLL